MLFALSLVVATLYSYFFESLNCKSTSLLKVALLCRVFLFINLSWNPDFSYKWLAHMI
jgi:hypothetical protein